MNNYVQILSIDESSIAITFFKGKEKKAQCIWMFETPEDMLIVKEAIEAWTLRDELQVIEEDQL